MIWQSSLLRQEDLGILSCPGNLTAEIGFCMCFQTHEVEMSCLLSSFTCTPEFELLIFSSFSPVKTLGEEHFIYYGLESLEDLIKADQAIGLYSSVFFLRSLPENSRFVMQESYSSCHLRFPSYVMDFFHENSHLCGCVQLSPTVWGCIWSQQLLISISIPASLEMLLVAVLH